MSEPLYQYLWIAIAAGIVGFFYTFGIGANDVANACEYSKAPMIVDKLLKKCIYLILI